MNLQKLDKFWIGLITGIIFPCLVFLVYWMFSQHQLSLHGFMIYLTNGQLLSNSIKLCGLGNLLIFYYALTKKLDRFNKGVIVSVVLYVGLVAYVSYFMEPEML